MEYYYRGCNTQYPPEKGDHFIVEDLLDFSNDDDGNSAIAGADDGSFGTAATAAHFTDLSISTSMSSCINPPFPVYQPHFCRSLADNTLFNDFCEPHDELQELQWLSNFEEEPFSNEDLEKLHLISGIKSSSSSSETSKPAAGKSAQSPLLRPENPVPSKARSKRSRAAPSSWSIRPVVIAASPALSPVSDVEPDLGKKPVKKKEPAESYRPRVAALDGRKCLHCGTDRTPQWRMGPVGPKTLCNACGVRFKSGRLVPEYRPAASPTFVMAEHSNSHRKVLELRRQKEQQHQFMHHGLVYDAEDGGDILIHDHAGPDFRQLI